MLAYKVKPGRRLPGAESTGLRKPRLFARRAWPLTPAPSLCPRESRVRFRDSLYVQGSPVFRASRHLLHALPPLMCFCSVAGSRAIHASVVPRSVSAGMPPSRGRTAGDEPQDERPDVRASSLIRAGCFVYHRSLERGTATAEYSVRFPNGRSARRGDMVARRPN